MKSLFKNFINALKHYRTASLLNIIGLSVAFTAFTIIMMQVRYDLQYDRFHRNSGHIYRMEGTPSSNWGYLPTTSRPLMEFVERNVPQVVSSGFADRKSAGWFGTDESLQEFHFLEESFLISPEILDMFDFNIRYGEVASFSLPEKVLMSETQARRYFGEANAVGRHIFSHADSTAYEVIAVYKDFPKNSFLKNTLYFKAEDRYAEMWNTWNNQHFVLLNSKIDLPHVERELHRKLIAEVEKFRERESDKNIVRFTPLGEVHFTNDLERFKDEIAQKSSVFILLTIALVIIAVAVINFINFSMSLVPLRLQSVNTRKVLGAGNVSIRAGMLFEAVGIALIAALLAIWFTDIICKSSLVNYLNADVRLSENAGTIGTLLAIAVVTGILAGIYPSFYITSFSPALVLKGSFGLTPKGLRLRNVLISFQYVISFTLIIVAFFIHLQGRYMKNFPMGFNQEMILTVKLPSDLARKNNTVRELLEKNPSVQRVAFAERVLVDETNGLMGWGYDKDGEFVHVNYFYVSPDFPQFMGLEIVEGRDFMESDRQTKGALILNETARTKYGISPGEEFNGYPVVGIVRDFHYLPLQQKINPFSFVVNGSEKSYSWARTAYVKISPENITGTIESIHRNLKNILPNMPDPIEVGFLDQNIAQIYEKEENLASMITLFSIFAVLISIIGVFGLILFETQYRRKEIGIRKINGASLGDILRMFTHGFLKLVCICFILSTPIAVYIILQWLNNFAYRSPVPIWIFLFTFLTILAITLLTITLQSYRTYIENPIDALKTD